MAERPAPVVTGTTQVLFVLGDPIAQVKAPALLNRLFRQQGTDAVVVPLHVDAAGLGPALDGLRTLRNLGGVVATVPHKIPVLPLMDALTEAAAQVGAVNVIRRVDGRWEGSALDGSGFVEGLRREGHAVAGRSVLLAGAGGAASQIAFAVAKAGAAVLAISNRNAARAGDLADRVAAAYPAAEVRTLPWTPDPSGFDLVVNGTSLGMRPDDPLPVAVDRLSVGQLVCEVVMAPRDTALLEAARAQGARVHHGIHMLEAQLQLWIDYWGVQ